MHSLRAQRIGIAPDHFGTAYAGLNYLQFLPYTRLTIDKVTVQQVNQSERSMHIIKAALELWHEHRSAQAAASRTSPAPPLLG